jgi:hypothetical protein
VTKIIARNVRLTKTGKSFAVHVAKRNMPKNMKNIQRRNRMADDAPAYICPACLWQGDEPIPCGNCGSLICPKNKCGEPVMTIEAYRAAEAADAHDAELEERRNDSANRH